MFVRDSPRSSEEIVISNCTFLFDYYFIYSCQCKHNIVRGECVCWGRGEVGSGDCGEKGEAASGGRWYVSTCVCM